jgi:hypothetical protein
MSDKKYTSIRREDAVGRVEFKGGKAVWEWSQDANDSTSILIKSLDNPELALEKTQRAPIVPASSKAPSGTDRTVGKESTPSLAPKSSRAVEQPDEDDTLWQLRAARERSFDPYNRS